MELPYTDRMEHTPTIATEIHGPCTVYVVCLRRMQPSPLYLEHWDISLKQMWLGSPLECVWVGYLVVMTIRLPQNFFRSAPLYTKLKQCNNKFSCELPVEPNPGICNCAAGSANTTQTTTTEILDQRPGQSFQLFCKIQSNNFY